MNIKAGDYVRVRLNPKHYRGRKIFSDGDRGIVQREYEDLDHYWWVWIPGTDNRCGSFKRQVFTLKNQLWVIHENRLELEEDTEKSDGITRTGEVKSTDPA